MQQLVQEYIPLCFVFLVACTIHEFAHAWSAYKLGDNTAYNEGRVTLNPLVHLDLMGTVCFLISAYAGMAFGWAKPVPVNPTRFKNPRRDNFLVTFAGPLSNLLMAVAACFVYVLIFKKHHLFMSVPPTGSSQEMALLFRVLSFMVTFNLLLFFFNLLPVYPLDGSHIVAALLPLNEAYKFTRFSQAHGHNILLLLILLGPISGGSVDPLRFLIWQPVMYLSQGMYSMFLNILV